MSKILIISFFLGNSICAFAQLQLDTLRHIYEQNTLLLTSKGVMENGVIQQKKPFGKDPLLSRLKTEPVAYKTFNKGFKQVFGGIGLSMGGVVLVGIAPVSFRFSENDGQKAISVGFGVVGAGLIALGVRKGNKASANMTRGVWAYNRAAILRGLPDSTYRQQAADWYDQKTVLLSGTGFVQNGIWQKRGFADAPLKEVFKSNTLALSNLEKSYQLKKRGTVLAWLGNAVEFAGLAQIFAAKNRTDLRTGWGVLLSVYLFSTFVGQPMLVQSSDHLNRAVWFYNRDSMF